MGPIRVRWEVAGSAVLVVALLLVVLLLDPEIEAETLSAEASAACARSGGAAP